MNVLIIAVALLIAGILAFNQRLRSSTSWRATLTPLASIMGSGFLVCAPLIGGIAGRWSALFMAALLLVAYCIGEAIRYNIRHFESVEHQKHGVAQKAALLSRVVLAVAYFISIAYYLQLLAAFVLHLLNVESDWIAKTISTSILAGIAGIGMVWGLDRLEKVEKYAVSLNLGMIAALLVALTVHNVSLWQSGEWTLPSNSGQFGAMDFRMLVGMLIVVQGFESSRYLGEKHPAEERIKTMRWAQWISSGIYIVFVSLMTVLFKDGMEGEVTEVISLTAPIAFVLPVCLTIAAVGSQFSASVADDAAAGGLLEDIFGIKQRQAYLVILLVSGALTWLTSVTEVIAIASRAFALFYALQCGVAVAMTVKCQAWGRMVFFGSIGLVALGVCIFGIPAEG